MAIESHHIPLLRDWHTHPFLYAALMDGLDLGRTPEDDRDGALARIRAHAARGAGWSIVYGWNSGRYSLAKEDFDQLQPLVVFNLSLHGLIVNDAGRDLLRRVDADAAVHLDDQEWIERNLQRVLNLFAVEGASVGRLRRFFRGLLDAGVYHAEEMLLADGVEVGLLDEAGLLGRTRLWAAPELYENLPASIRGRVHGIKLFADGALGASTAALHAPYRGTTGKGFLMYEDQELAGLLERYLGTGTPVAIHAIGERAIDQVVACVDTAGALVDAEVRIEHAQLISPATAERAKELGIRLCMQPNFSDDSVHYLDRLPAGYAERNNPFRMLIDEAGFVPGADLVFGSDGMPHGVSESLRQALFPPHAGQTLTVDEFTAGYGAPEAPGHLEVEVDTDRRTVTHRVIIDAAYP